MKSHRQKLQETLAGLSGQGVVIVVGDYWFPVCYRGTGPRHATSRFDIPVETSCAPISKNFLYNYSIFQGFTKSDATKQVVPRFGPVSRENSFEFRVSRFESNRKRQTVFIPNSAFRIAMLFRTILVQISILNLLSLPFEDENSQGWEGKGETVRPAVKGFRFRLHASGVAQTASPV